MNLVAVSVDAILIGQPLPCSLRDAKGALLASRGFLVNDRQELEMMVGKRNEIYIDSAQSENFKRAYVNRLNNLVMEDRELGEIASTQFSPYDFLDSSYTQDSSDADWLNLQSQAHALLRDSRGETFLPRLARLQAELERQLQSNPDGTLFALIHLTGSELKHYSATHSMLVFVMCHLAARDVLKWPGLEIQALGKAALTMNLGMTDLQDRLALQTSPLTPDQVKRIDSHAARSVDILQEMGVTDRLWLEAVLYHRAQVPGPLAKRGAGRRLARLIQRADMFGARLAPRSSRQPDAPNKAMQSCYFDEERQIDEAGAALIKAVGVYAPGSYVRLTSGEIAVVVKRGINSTMPKVAVLINRQGMVTAEPFVRDTSQTEFRITNSLRYREVKVHLSLERLLTLTKYSATDRAF